MKCAIGSFFIAATLACASAQEEPIPDLTADPKPKPDNDYAPPALVEKDSKGGDLKLPNVTTSVTKAFTLYGGNVNERTLVANVAESVLTEIRMELKDDALAELSTPIQISLVRDKEADQEGPAFAKSFGTLATGAQSLRLSVHLGRKFTTEELRSAIAEMIVLERCVAGTKKIADDAKLVVHPWLVDGLLEVMDWRAKRADRRDYALLSKKPQLFDVEKMLDVRRGELRKMDSASLNAYRAASGAMVMALLKHPEGLEKMREMLAEAALFQGDVRNLIKRYFPEVNKGKNGLRVAWLLQLNEMSMAPLTDSYTILQTEKLLDEALEFRYLNEDGAEVVLKLKDFEALAKVDEMKRKSAVALASKRLVQLNYRCFPVYRPMLFRYGTILNALSQGETKGIAESVQQMAQERGLRKLAAERARDYLDWYAIQSASAVKGDFKPFSKIDDDAKAKAAQQNRMGKYLDRLETLYAPRK